MGVSSSTWRSDPRPASSMRRHTQLGWSSTTPRMRTMLACWRRERARNSQRRRDSIKSLSPPEEEELPNAGAKWRR